MWVRSRKTYTMRSPIHPVCHTSAHKHTEIKRGKKEKTVSTKRTKGWAQ